MYDVPFKKVMPVVKPQLGGNHERGDSSLLVFGMIAPVYERVFELDHLALGHVNRANNTYDVASGASITAARAASTMGANVLLVTTAGGDTGLGLRRLLAAAPFACLVVNVETATRNVISVVTETGGGATVVVEPSRAMTAVDVLSFREAVLSRVANSHYVLLGGSLPPEVPSDTYASLVTEIQSSGRTVAIDTRGTALARCVEAGARVVKLNLEQLPSSVDLAEDGAILEYLQSLNRLGCDIVICSAGGAPARVIWKGKGFSVTPPRVELKNQFGSGDAALGVLLWALEHNESPETSLRFFSAAGAANAETLLPGLFARDRVYELMTQVRVDPWLQTR